MQETLPPAKKPKVEAPRRRIIVVREGPEDVQESGIPEEYERAHGE